MSTLILAAETDIINATIPQSKKKPLVPESWATFRNRYVATLTKPMWTFYRDNIVDAEILGEKVKASTDSSGVHKDVAAVLPLLEQSAMRLGGFATKADLIKAKQRPGSEFRFEAMSHPDWMGRARHLSFHGTGRAMDFRSQTNPDFGGPTHQLVSVLGEGELSELSAGSTPQRQDLQKVATHNADVVSLRGQLKARLAAATDDQEKARLQGDIERIDAHLRDSVQTDRTTVRVRDRASETHQQVKAIEAMVEAFAERGWQWGMWSGFADAMHFDYMGPVADVRSDAQYH
jgi:D-alanyl-D-alanine carboxypeptidase